MATCKTIHRKRDESSSKEEEPIYLNHYDPEALHKIIETQHKVIEYQKKQNHKKVFSILIIVDDFADDPSFSRHSKMLHALYTRGRHNSRSTIIATQKFASIAPIIRVNATELFVYRLRNAQDLQTFLDEISALMDKKKLYWIFTTWLHQNPIPFSL